MVAPEGDIRVVLIKFSPDKSVYLHGGYFRLKETIEFFCFLSELKFVKYVKGNKYHQYDFTLPASINMQGVKSPTFSSIFGVSHSFSTFG